MLTLTASAVERLRPLLAQQMANRKSLSDTERLIVWGILFPYAFSMFPFLLFFLIYQMKQWALGWNYLMTTTSNLLMQLIWFCLYTLTLIVLLAMYPPVCDSRYDWSWPSKVLDFLLHYTEFHFANEETLFAKYNYPQSASHKKERISQIENFLGRRRK